MLVGTIHLPDNPIDAVPLRIQVLDDLSLTKYVVHFIKESSKTAVYRIINFTNLDWDPG